MGTAVPYCATESYSGLKCEQWLQKSCINEMRKPVAANILEHLVCSKKYGKEISNIQRTVHLDYNFLSADATQY
jgi:hypothetical protein